MVPPPYRGGVYLTHPHKYDPWWNFPKKMEYHEITYWVFSKKSICVCDEFFLHSWADKG